MEQLAFAANLRSGRGKGPGRRSRAAGRVPGVVYGMGREPLALDVDTLTLDKLLRSHAGTNVLLSLDVAGAAVVGDTLALLKSVQRHPVSRALVSVDLQWVDASKAIRVAVPIVLDGEAKGTTFGGILEHGVTEVEVWCLPTSIPESFVVDVRPLELGGALHVRDLQVFEGVEILGNPDDVVATCAMLRTAVEAPAEAAEEVEAAEGEAAEAEGEEAAE